MSQKERRQKRTLGKDLEEANPNFQGDPNKGPHDEFMMVKSKGVLGTDPMNQLSITEIEDKHLEEEEEVFKNERFHWRKLPLRIVLICLVLDFIGVCFVCAGVPTISIGDLEKGVPFLVFGCFILIPGVYYTVQLVRVLLSKNIYEQNEILSDLPIQ